MGSVGVDGLRLIVSLWELPLHKGGTSLRARAMLPPWALFYLNRMFFTDIFLCIHKFQKKDALFCAIQCTLCLEEGLIHCRCSVSEELNA